jgi:hypothetical protein
VWAFLAQVLSKQKACVAAVARVMVLRLALGLPPCAEETGAYCEARAKLSESFQQRLGTRNKIIIPISAFVRRCRGTIFPRRRRA